MILKYIKKSIVAIMISVMAFGSSGTTFAQQTTIRPLPISTFTGLRDTPNSYTGDALDLVRVNAAETGLEFFTGSSSFASTLATVSSFSDTTAKSLYQMTSAQNVEFRTSDATSLLLLNEASKSVNITGQLNIDNLRFDGNTLSSPSGDIVVSPTGSLTLNSSSTGLAGINSGWTPLVDTANRYSLYNAATTITSNSPHASATFTSFEGSSFYSGSGTFNTLYGSYYTARNTGVGTTSDLIGAGFWLRNTGAGTVGNMTGIRLISPTNSGTISGVTRGLYVENLGLAGVTNNYGIYINSQTGATNNYALYTNSGDVRFGDNVNVVSTTEQLRLGYDASNYASFTVGSAGKLNISTTAEQVGINSSNAYTTLMVQKDAINSRVYYPLAIDASTQSKSVLGSGTGIIFGRSSGGNITGAIASYANGTTAGVGIWGTPSVTAGSNSVYSTSTPDFYVHSNGNVGIGTVLPLARFHVQGAGTSNPAIDGETSAVFSRTTGAGTNSQISIISGTTGNAVLRFGDTASEGRGQQRYNNNTDGFEWYTAATVQAYLSSAGQFSLGATANASAILQADSTTQGFLPPRMTTTQKNAISSPATGLVVFDTTLAKLAVYTGAGWETVTSL